MTNLSFLMQNFLEIRGGFRLSRILAAASIYLVLFGYFYSFSHYGLNIWDEGGYANGTLRTFEGQSALKDFNPNGYPPGRYLYGALFFKLFGVSIQSLRIGVILLTPIMVMMVYAAARRIMPVGFAALAGFMMVSAPGMYYNRFFPFFCVLNLHGLVRYLERGSLSRLAVLTGSLLLSFYFKVEVGIFSTVISVFLIALLGRDRRHRNQAEGSGAPEGIGSAVSSRISGKIGLFVLISGLMAVATAGFFIQHDSLAKIWAMVLETHRVWGNPFPAVFPFAALWKEWGEHEMFERIMFYLPLLVYGIAALLLVYRWRNPGSGFDGHTPVLAAVLLFGICAYGLVIWRAGFDNLLRTLPPFYILFCYLLFRARAGLLRIPSGSPPPAEREPGSIPPVKKYAVNVSLLLLPFLFLYEMNVNHGFYAGTAGAVRFETAPLKMDRADVYTHPREAGWLMEVVRRIRNQTRAGEAVFALPLNPIFYFLADRPNPTAYDWILPGMLDEKEQGRVVSQLAANPPGMIIYVDIAIDNREERRFHNYAPVIYKYIAGHYGLQEIIGFFQILVPKDPADGGETGTD